jgi:hypothetical protein
LPLVEAAKAAAVRHVGHGIICMQVTYYCNQQQAVLFVGVLL